MKNYNLASLLSKYLNNYLTIQKNSSNHTIRSYKLTFKLFVKYLINNCNINIKDINLIDLNRNNVINFLNQLSCSITTRNQRLAAIKSFCN